MELADPCYKASMKQAKKRSPDTPASGTDDDRTRSWRGIVGPGGATRADIYVAETAEVLSRSQIKARSAVIRVNGSVVKPSRPLKPGDRLEVLWREEDSASIDAEDIPLSVLYQDERVIVVDKAQGMVTHPGAGNRRGTLANAVLHIALCERVSRADLSDKAAMRPPPARAGIVHRLDKDTSGVIVAAKDLEAQVFLSGQFKERSARKEYLAITRGIPLPPSGRIADRLGRDKRDRKRFASVPDGGKPAVTDYRVLSSWSAPIGGSVQGGGYSLVSLRPRTGRTHQLRVHMAGLGAPILGDPIYGKKDGTFPGASLMLHSYRLKIALPGADTPVIFTAPLPRRFRETLDVLASAFGRGSPSPYRGGRPDQVP